MHVTPEARRHAQELLDFIDLSPSPWHAVAAMEGRLQAAGFARLEEDQQWEIAPGDRLYVVRGGSSLIALRVGTGSPLAGGFRIVGAHTDSPGLRVKPQAPHVASGWLRLGVEVYGSPILATFADRDLSLAGRVYLREEGGVGARLMRSDRALLRLPNLAIHMNRTVNEEGLKLDKQTGLPLLLADQEAAEPTPEARFAAWLGEAAGCDPAAILSFELNVYDTQPAAFWGPEGEFLAASRIDNLSSCHAGLAALLAVDPPKAHTAVVACFDHEEVGSESHKGADGSFLPDVLERVAQAVGLDPAGYRQARAGSFLVSADAAHGLQPNFPNAYEPQHHVRVNGGPVIKLNSNQRYATDGLTEARFMQLCHAADVPWQKYVHRTDLACGSTIGPMTAAALGMPAVDCGCPMWAMHSIRESAGVLDQAWLARVLREFLGGGGAN